MGLAVQTHKGNRALSWKMAAELMRYQDVNHIRWWQRITTAIYTN